MEAQAETAERPDLERLKPVSISRRRCHDSRLDSKTKDPRVCKLFCKIRLPQNAERAGDDTENPHPPSPPRQVLHQPARRIKLRHGGLGELAAERLWERAARRGRW